MHSSEYMHEEPVPDRAQPYPAYTPELFSMAHNGDFSGDVSFFIEGWRVDQEYAAESQFARHHQPIMRVKIPFAILGQLVAEAVLTKKVSDLEQADYKTLLGLD